MKAAATGRLELLLALLLDGAQIEARSADGSTALRWAVIQGHLQVVKALLKAGAHAERLDKQLAEQLGHSQIADIL